MLARCRQISLVDLAYDFLCMHPSLSLLFFCEPRYVGLVQGEPVRALAFAVNSGGLASGARGHLVVAMTLLNLHVLNLS